MKLRWTIILSLAVALLLFVVLLRPFGPAIDDMAPKGTVFVATFSNPAKTMEVLDRSGVFMQVLDFYKLKPLPSQVQLALIANKLVVIFGRHPQTKDRFLVFAFDYSPTTKLISLKEKGGIYRSGELYCFSDKACAKKHGRYMLAGTKADLESYVSALTAGLVEDEAAVANLKNVFVRSEITLFLFSFEPVVEALKEAGDLDLSLLVDPKSFAGLGIFGDIDETGIHIAGEIFSRTGKQVLKLDASKNLPLLEPTKTKMSLAFNLGSVKTLENMFERALGVRTEGDGVAAQLRKMVIESFVSTLSGKAAAALTKTGTSWALELSRPEEMRSYLALLKRNLTGEDEFDSNRIELVFPPKNRTVICEGKWLVIGSQRDAASALLAEIKSAQVGGPYGLWLSFWAPVVEVDGPTMIYIYGQKSNLIKGYVPKAMVPKLPLAKEISRSKTYKLVVRFIYYGALTLAIALIGLSVYKLSKLSRPRRERRPSSRKA